MVLQTTVGFFFCTKLHKVQRKISIGLDIFEGEKENGCV